MLRWIFLSVVLTVSLAEEPAVAEANSGAVPDSKAEESQHHDDHDIKYHDYGEDLPGTGVLREIHPSGHPLPQKRIEKQNKIVYDRYSPNYYQPTWYLDYRYLKTGGRDYVRGEGGQILILPAGVKAPHDENKLFGNFDELLEFLRLQELANRESLSRSRSGHKEHHEEDHKYHGHKNDKKHNVGWQQEAEREGRNRENYEDLLKEYLVNVEQEDKKERRQQKHYGQSWESEAFGKYS